MCERSPQTRERIAAGMRQYWKDPANRVARREGARLRRIERRLAMRDARLARDAARAAARSTRDATESN
jgi:hypothetical protein